MMLTIVGRVTTFMRRRYTLGYDMFSFLYESPQHHSQTNSFGDAHTAPVTAHPQHPASPSLWTVCRQTGGPLLPRPQ